MKREFNTFKHNYDLEEEGRNISCGVRRGAFGTHICFVTWQIFTVMSSFTAGLDVRNVRAVLKSILEFHFPVFYFRYWHFSFRDSYPFSWSLFSSLVCYVFSFLHTDSFWVTVISTWKLRLGTHLEVSLFPLFSRNI